MVKKAIYDKLFWDDPEVAVGAFGSAPKNAFDRRDGSR
jgi:hypothetical protein